MIRNTLSIFAAALLLVAGCAHDNHLADAERARLSEAPSIHVMHYETPLPEVRSRAKNPPAAASIRHQVAADPAALIASNFARMLGRKEKLRNIQTDNAALARPVRDDARVGRSRYKDGLALEMWTDEWSYNQTSADPNSYTMTLAVRARLSRLTDGHVLWSSARCENTGTRDQRLSSADLASDTRVRKVLAAARDECARQLLRDFGQRDGKS